MEELSLIEIFSLHQPATTTVYEDNEDDNDNNQNNDDNHSCYDNSH